MTIALTGADGFLGWHTRCAARALGETSIGIKVGDSFDQEAASAALAQSSRAIHIAGVNRGTDEDVREGNLRFAEQFSAALREADTPPEVVVFANSIQSGNGTVYGESKARAAELVAAAADAVGAEFFDFALPNLFGEHGTPFYNMVTATFCRLIADGEEPSVDNDNHLTLLHAQDAADLLLGEIGPHESHERERAETVRGLADRIQGYSHVYRAGEIPDVSDDFDRDLFNTYRSYTFPTQAPVVLTRHADARGSFFEIIRNHGGTGQSSFSTTVPGVTRGDHYHRRKIERFTVLQGRGRIALRRLYSDEVVSFYISGDEPQAVDMPTMWAHNIENVGDELLYTSFWTNDIFDPSNPDTIAEVV